MIGFNCFVNPSIHYLKNSSRIHPGMLFSDKEQRSPATNHQHPRTAWLASSESRWSYSYLMPQPSISLRLMGGVIDGRGPFTRTDVAD
jgi:hypothetical protein